jgi:hypothetical protein
MHGDDDTLWPVRPDQPMRKRTACSLLGEIYRLIEADRAQEALPLINECHHYFKKMDRRLRDYAAAAGNPCWAERGFWTMPEGTKEP